MQDISGSAGYSTAWTDEAYRIMDFGETPQEVDEAFYTYFMANAEPVAEPALIAFTISGIDYQAEEGMTWSEWVPALTSCFS